MKTILVVEDDEKTAFALCVRLKAHGFATWVAGDAVSGLSMALRNRPNLILLDISLPAGNGFTLAEQLSQFPETHNTPIVLATASKDPELRQKALSLGAAGLLRKPYDAEELLHAVDEALENCGETNLLIGDLQPSRFKMERERGPRRVLIVEDDERLAKGLAIRMDAAGFETTVATDGMAGVRCAMATKPDVVVLDISLPAGDGFAVAESIQAHIPTPARIIFLTASARPEFRARAAKLGAVGFFEKPYEVDSLLATIRQATE